MAVFVTLQHDFLLAIALHAGDFLVRIMLLLKEIVEKQGQQAQ